MNDLTLEEVEEKCKNLAEELLESGYEVLLIAFNQDYRMISGTKCIVCAQEELNEFITTNNIKHSKLEFN